MVQSKSSCRSWPLHNFLSILGISSGQNQTLPYLDRYFVQGYVVSVLQLALKLKTICRAVFSGMLTSPRDTVSLMIHFLRGAGVPIWVERESDPHVFCYLVIKSGMLYGIGQAAADLVQMASDLVTDNPNPTWTSRFLSQTYDSAAGNQGDWRVNASLVCVQGALTIDGLRAGYAILYYTAVGPLFVDSCFTIIISFNSRSLDSSLIANQSVTDSNVMPTPLLRDLLEEAQ